MTVSQLCVELGADRSAVAAALEFFVHRGDVSREVEGPTGVTCGTVCKNCPIAGACLAGGNALSGMEVFVWNDPAATAVSHITLIGGTR